MPDNQNKSLNKVNSLKYLDDEFNNSPIQSTGDQYQPKSPIF